MTMAWLVVMTKPRQEAKAAAHLVEQSFEVYLPKPLSGTRWGVLSAKSPYFRAIVFVVSSRGSQSPAFAPPRVSWPPFDLVNRLPI